MGEPTPYPPPSPRGALPMMRSHCWLVLGSSLVRAAARGQNAEADKLAALAARIDQRIAAEYTTQKLTPAAQADDAEFLRRVYLDLAGRIPRVSETRQFLADPSPDKRRRLVDQLLESPHYANHFTNIWRSLLVSTVNQQFQAFSGQLDPWLRQRF